jgi:hypothetical protein
MFSSFLPLMIEDLPGIWGLGFGAFRAIGAAR